MIAAPLRSLIEDPFMKISQLLGCGSIRASGSGVPGLIGSDSGKVHFMKKFAKASVLMKVQGMSSS